MSNKAKTKRSRGHRQPSRTTPTEALCLFGKHAVAAAMKNPERPLRAVFATDAAFSWLEEQQVDRALLKKVIVTSQRDISERAPTGAVHQGIVALVDALPRARLKDACAPIGKDDRVVVLDQVTDPQNIGSIFRVATAFRARAVIVQDRRTPPLDGALAKAAVGAIEKTPCVQVVNIARALEGLQGLGYLCIGLDGDATKEISEAPIERPLALVMGAEGAGLRPLVRETCDAICKIEMSDAVESLNVASATAIALYATRSSITNPHQ